MACRTSWAGRWCLKVGELRRPSIDFAELDELAEGDTLTGTPTVTIDPDSGVEITGATVDGTEVAFWADCTDAVVAEEDQIANGGPGYTDYAVVVTVGTVGGAVLSRSATLRIEE